MLSDAQLERFHTDGYVTVEGAVSTEDIASMQTRLLRRIERNGIVLDDPDTWPKYVTNLQSIRKGDPAPADCAPVADALDQVFGSDAWHSSAHWGQALVTFPTPGPWTVPHHIWHLDHPYLQPKDRITGVNLFLFVDDVAPRGGGTGAIKGSPRLIREFGSTRELRGKKMKVIRKQFDASDPWLRDLTRATTDDRVARFMDQDTDVHGVPTRVVELTGRAGDAVLCHPWLIHCGTPNTSDRPRLMRAGRVYDKEWLARRTGESGRDAAKADVAAGGVGS